MRRRYGEFILLNYDTWIKSNNILRIKILLDSFKFELFENPSINYEIQLIRDVEMVEFDYKVT